MMKTISFYESQYDALTMQETRKYNIIQKSHIVNNKELGAPMFNAFNCYNASEVSIVHEVIYHSQKDWIHIKRNLTNGKHINHTINKHNLENGFN